MFILKNNYLKGSLILTAMLLLFYGCSDSNDDDTQVTPPPTKEDTLSLDRQALLFDADDENRPEIIISTTADFYEVACEENWVKITSTNKSFFVSVDPYTQQQAADADYIEREATITVTAGTAEPKTVKIKQNSPLETRLYIYTEPGSLYFEVGEYKAVFELFTNIPNITYSVPSEFDWLTDVDMTANFIAVTLEEYIGDDIREGYIILSSADSDLHYKLWIYQENVLPTVGLEGEWNWTGLQWTPSGYEPQSGTVNISYDEEQEFYYVEPFEDYLSGYDVPAGGMALRIDEENNVHFIALDKFFMYKMISFMGEEAWFSYRNGVAYIDPSDMDIEEVPADTVFTIELTNDGNTMIFPNQDNIGGYRFDLVFGFGGYFYESGMEYDFLGLNYFGLWKDFEFTKVP